MPAIVEAQHTTYPQDKKSAPGAPGTAPRWSPSNKTAVGAAVCMDSRVWFALRDGSIDEIYYPDVDSANTRSVRFLITDGDTYFSDESGAAHHDVSYVAEGVPGFSVVNTCTSGRYRLTKTICCDPARCAVLLHVEFEDLMPGETPLRLFLLVDPQVSDEGRHNVGWIGSYKGLPMLCASNGGTYLAALSDIRFLETTCTFHGKHDAVEELREHKHLLRNYNYGEGNAVLCAELAWKERTDGFLVAVAFGRSDSEACLNARAGVHQPFDHVLQRFIEQWKQRQAEFADIPDRSGSALNLYRVSTAVLEAHQSKAFPGASVASLSIPWGFAKGDKDAGGYHVAWPRDLVEVSMGELAAGHQATARASLLYLSCTQEDDGSWAQNMWLDGTRHWGAIQKDGIAMPILLAARLHTFQQLEDFDPWPMVYRAVCFLVETGPGTEQDRWETTPGYNAFTMACEIVALHAAATLARERGKLDVERFLRETADAWNEAIECYLWVEDTELGRKHGADGYYQRIAPPEIIQNRDRTTLRTVDPNHRFGLKSRVAQEIICVDALALVRFGLRRPDDPRILSTLEMIDKVLGYDLPTGRAWRRYNNDGYGEHADGAPYDGTGVGRCWPLLAGERAHYEIAAGNMAFAEELCRTIGRQTSECGMIPEQVWNAEDIPERGLWKGRPSGSGMPLAWAHSEFIRLLCSLEKGHVWDRPQPIYQRYVEEGTRSDLQIWTEREPREWITEGHRLRIDLKCPARVHWGVEGDPMQEVPTADSGVRVQTVTLDVRHLPAGSWLMVELREQDRGKVWKHKVLVRPRPETRIAGLQQR